MTILRRRQWYNVHRSLRKVPDILVRFYPNLDFYTSLQYQISLKSVQWEPSKRTHRHNEANRRFSWMWKRLIWTDQKNRIYVRSTDRSSASTNAIHITLWNTKLELNISPTVVLSESNTLKKFQVCILHAIADEPAMPNYVGNITIPFSVRHCVMCWSWLMNNTVYTRARHFFSPPKRPDRLWVPLSLLYNGHRTRFLRG